MGKLKRFFNKQKERIREERTNAQVRNQMARKAYYEEREKQAVQTAKWKTQQEGKRARTKTSSGGVFGGIQSYAKTVSKGYGGSMVAPSAFSSTSKPRRIKRMKKRRGKSITIHY